MTGAVTVRSVRDALLRPQVALGLLPLAIEERRDGAAARAVVAAALDAGVGVFDTADVYGRQGEPPGYAELVLATFLTPARRADGVLVATKGGVVRLPDGSRRPCGRPEHLRAACEASVRRLGVEAIDLYQLHRVDPDIPFEESLGALIELVDRGLVRAIGLSNVPCELIDRGRQVAGERLVSVQNQFSPVDVGTGEHRHCRDLGLAFLAWGVLGGVDAAGSLAQRCPAAARVAAARGVSVQRVVVAWALAQGVGVVPVIGARRAASIEDSAAAVELTLTGAELTAITPAGAA